MPSYVKAKIESIGEMFAHCNTKKVMNTIKNSASFMSDDCCILKAVHWELTPLATNDPDKLYSTISITVPAYEPIVSSAFNAVHQKLAIESFSVFNLIRTPTGNEGVKIESTYDAKNGRILNIMFNASSSGSGDTLHSTITIDMEFDEMIFDDKKVNTAGYVGLQN